MSIKDSPRYRIQAVAQRTGVPAATLRAWERRYGVPNPVRTDAAYRTYSERDVKLIERLRQLCDSGLSPSDAASLIRDEQTGGSPMADPQAVSLNGETSTELASDAHDAAVVRLTSAVRSMNLEAMEAGLLEVRELGSSQQIFDNVVQPTMIAVGDLWHRGEISIGHEHLATEMLRGLARDLLRLAQPTQSRGLALLACFADELHTGSLYGIGLRLAGWGFRVAILGALTPPVALSSAVRKLQPSIVGLSVTVAPSAARARELLEGYADACGDVPWIVGGRGAPAIATMVSEFDGLVAPDNPAKLDELLEHVLSTM